MNNFGELRSAVHSLDTEAIVKALTGHKGDMLAALTYIKGNLGYIPATHWSNCRDVNCPACRRSTTTNPVEVFRDWDAPLSAELRLGGRRIELATWSSYYDGVDEHLGEIRREMLELEGHRFVDELGLGEDIAQIIAQLALGTKKELLKENRNLCFRAIEPVSPFDHKNPTKTALAARAITASCSWWTMYYYSYYHGGVPRDGLIGVEMLSKKILADVEPIDVVNRMRQ